MTICIVEDNTSLLNNLRLLLDGEPDMEVTGCYETAEEALRKAQWGEIDILLVDLELSGISGLALIRRVSALNRDTRIMAYTIHENRATVLAAIRAGARGYIVKGCRPSQLIAALHDIYNGGAPMSPSVAHTVLAELQALPAIRVNPNTRQIILSMREQTILQYLSQGMTYKEIANRLSIATSTVHTHIKNLYSKLNAHDKHEAVHKGRRHNLL